MDDKEHRSQQIPFMRLALIAAAIAAATAAVGTLLYRWGRQRKLATLRPSPAPPVIPVQGLTEAEAEARQVEGQDNVIQLKPPRTKQEIWKDNAYNTLNFSLVGLAGLQLLMGRPLDALLSLGTIALNIGLNVLQEMLAQRRLADIQQATRPRITVVRENKIRSIDPDKVAVGDAIVLGVGDQLLVDGTLIGEEQLLVDESMLTGGTARQTKRPGDRLWAGSICLSGRAACLVDAVGSERLVATQLVGAPVVKEELTSIERIIHRILQGLLAVVAVFATVLLIRYLRWDYGFVPVDAFNEVAGLVFSIAPVTLFFMIVVTYASGTADLARLGALVKRARSVESLAETSVICFAQAGVLTGTHVEIAVPETDGGEIPLSEARLRQILGDFARTSSVDSIVVRALRRTFDGEQRIAVEEAPFLSVYGWSALSFDDDDLRGVFVLGEPDILKALLSFQDTATSQDGREGKRSPRNLVRRAASPLGGLFRRGDNQHGELAGTPTQSERQTATAALNSAGSDGSQSVDPAPSGIVGNKGSKLVQTTAAQDQKSSADGSGRTVRARTGGFFRGLGKRVSGLVRRGDGDKDTADAAQEGQTEQACFSFAYSPNLVAIHDTEGRPHLPDGLVPLCSLRYSQRVSPEVVETIKTFASTGLAIKVFSADEPERVARMARQAGLTEEEGFPLDPISASELALVNGPEYISLVKDKSVFGRLSPDEAGRVVAGLREAGETVAVVGDRVGDLPAMRQANLAITTKSSTQAALSIADIILLEDSPSTLGVVLAKGQRIVNGLLDILKVNLTQAIYLALLLFAVPLLAQGYPFRSGQGTAISITTVAIPSLALTLGAAAGVLPSANLKRLLARFVIPTSTLTGLVAFVVYMLFLARSGEIAYAQLGATYILVACGLGTVVFVKPPRPGAWSGSAKQGAWWPVGLAILLMFLFLLVSAIPLAQRFLYLGPLQVPEDYVTVVLAFAVWALTLRFILFLIPVDPGYQKSERPRRKVRS